MTSLHHLSDKSLLIIMDGYGLSETSPKNAIKAAHKPNLDQLFAHYPMTQIEAGGEAVGLPKGVSGNSEVGHMNLGAGRPVRQDLVRINEAIEEHSLEQMERFQELVSVTKKGSGRVHLLGLLSDGGVHSHINHLKYIANALNAQGLKLFLHAFMDGRDTARDVGAKFVEETAKFPLTFASMQGRSIGMDRDRRWEKIELCLRTITGKGARTQLSPLDYIKAEYQKEIYDEFITPTLFEGEQDNSIRPGDSVFFFNFRPDRAIQITLAMTDPNFTHFKRDFMPNYFLCMTPYVPDEVVLPILFDKEKVAGGMSEYLAGLGKKQLKIAETEKYAHVTFFFNGGEKSTFPGEQHVLIPSPREVKTYDQKPQMSAFEVTDRLVAALENDEADFYLVNFANSDMVGHTGNYEAAIKAVETVDQCVGRLWEVCEKKGITMVITADHGNSDQMVYEDGSPHTSHTGAPVPFAVCHPKIKDLKIAAAPGKHALKDVSPSMLYFMGIAKPDTFEGNTIFQ